MSILRRQPWGFLLGLGIGSSIGVVLTNFLSKKFFKENKQEGPTNEELMKYYDGKIKEILSQTGLKENLTKLEDTRNPNNFTNHNVPKEALEADGSPKKTEDYQPKKTEKDYVSYNKMYQKSDGTEFQTREEIKMDPYPHKITADQWAADKNYSKVSLIYYEIDGVFATVGDEPTDYKEEYFGAHNINEFGCSSNSGMGHDSWTLMLRDELTKTDFQIYYDGNNSWETVYQNTGGEKD